MKHDQAQPNTTPDEKLQLFKDGYLAALESIRERLQAHIEAIERGEDIDGAWLPFGDRSDGK